MTPAQRVEIEVALKHQKRVPKEVAAFIAQIELLIASYRGGRDFMRGVTPKKVRANLNSLEQKAHALQNAYRRADDYSHHLLDQQGRGPRRSVPAITTAPDGSIEVGKEQKQTEGFSAHQAFVAVHYLREHARLALATTKQYRVTKLTDWSSLNLAVDVAQALNDILGVQPTTDPNNSFSAILTAALNIARADTGSRQMFDVSRLVRRALQIFKAESRSKSA